MTSGNPDVTINILAEIKIMATVIFKFFKTMFFDV